MSSSRRFRWVVVLFGNFPEPEMGNFLIEEWLDPSQKGENREKVNLRRCYLIRETIGYNPGSLGSCRVCDPC